jgi:acetyl esterase/lipase
MSWQAKVITAISKLTVKRKLGTMGSIEKERASLSRVSKMLARVPKGETVEVGGVPGEWLSPPGVDDSRVILFLHGGAYVMGGPYSHRDMAFDIAKASSARAFLADYRLGPEHPFPAAVEDGVAAYRGIVASGMG